jgi:hypothetical protein
MYVVNRSSDKTRYIRDMNLSAEVSGKEVQFKRQDDLLAHEFDDRQYEYGLRDREDTFREEPQPLKRLYSQLPLALAPEQPAKGWVRFMATEINANKITQGTIKLTVIDSLGKEYSIHKVPMERERRGEIGSTPPSRLVPCLRGCPSD